MRRKKGFTMIELLISIAIIGILVAIMVGALNPAFQLKKARDGRRKADLEQLRAAFEQYRADVGNYPNPTTNMTMCGSGQSLTNGSTVYIQNIPCDPLGTAASLYNSGVYEYVTLNGNTQY